MNRIGEECMCKIRVGIPAAGLQAAHPTRDPSLGHIMHIGNAAKEDSPLIFYFTES